MTINIKCSHKNASCVKAETISLHYTCRGSVFLNSPLLIMSLKSSIITLLSIVARFLQNRSILCNTKQKTFALPLTLTYTYTRKIILAGMFRRNWIKFVCFATYKDSCQLKSKNSRPCVLQDANLVVNWQKQRCVQKIDWKPDCEVMMKWSLEEFHRIHRHSNHGRLSGYLLSSRFRYQHPSVCKVEYLKRTFHIQTKLLQYLSIILTAAYSFLKSYNFTR